MRFADIKIDAGVRDALVGMVDSGKIPHALMFHENDGNGGISVCLAFLEYLFCTNRASGDACGACPSCNKIEKVIHPDVHFVYPVAGGSIIPASAKPTSLSYVKQWRELVLQNPFFTESDLNEALGIEGKSSLIAVAEARIILDKLSFNSLEGGYKAVVIYLPEKMNAETANRLLKSIEEPPEKTLFLMVTHSPERVLTTISSRCQLIRLLPVRRSALSGNANVAEERALFENLLDMVVARDFFSALEVGEKIAALPSRGRMKSFCAVASELLREIFLCQQSMTCISSSDEAAAAASKYSTLLKKSFARSAMPLLDKASMLVDRNVNSKIVFCDLVNRLFIIR